MAVTPTERIKTALIDDAKGAKRFRSTLHGIAVLVREQGLSGIYRGLISTTMKQSATSAVRMGTYNAIKSKYVSRYGHSPTGVAETFAMGAASGLVTVGTAISAIEVLANGWTFRCMQPSLSTQSRQDHKAHAASV